jgi:ATP-dependent helicase HrpA
MALHCARDMKFLKRSLTLPEELHPAAHLLGGARRLEEAMVQRVTRDLFARDLRSESAFNDHAAVCAAKLLPAGRELLYALIPVLQAYAAASRDIAALSGAKGVLASVYRQLTEALANLLPQNFIALYDRARLAHIERYLQALSVRASRALVDPEKDRAKAQGPQNYTEHLRRLMKTLNAQSSGQKRQAIEELAWMIEEYKVSVFAQELKTAVPMSAKRLEEKIREIERMA